MHKRLQIEFNPEIDGIGVSPKLILNLQKEYGKILKLEFSNYFEIAARMQPVPFHFHGSLKLILPSIWEKLYKIDSDYAICSILEPGFAKSINITPVIKEIAGQLPPFLDSLDDKSVLFKDKFIRFTDDKIYQITSFDSAQNIAICDNSTSITIPPDKKGEEPQTTTISKAHTFGTNSKEVEKSAAKQKLKPQIAELTFENLNKLKGIDEVIHRLKREVIFPFIEELNGENANPVHTGGVLLYGPPGCGKTEIPHSIAKDLGIEFFPIKIEELASPYRHDFSKNLAKKFKEAATNKNGALIFLDEFDSYAGKRTNDLDKHDKEEVNNLLQVLDPKNLPTHILVFAATNLISDIDTAVIRSGRFDTKIPIFPPDQIGRAQILRQKIKDTGLNISEITDEYVNEMAKKCAGFVGGDLHVLIKKARGFAKMEAFHNKASLILSESNIAEAKTTILPLCETEMDIKKPTLTKSDLPGSEGFIERICKEINFILEPEMFRNDLEYKPDRGFLLYGPPGTGKTSIANAVANELGLLFKVVKSNELISKWHGESGQNIRKLFEQARLFRPILLFFDEIDSIATSRDTTTQSFENDSLYALLNEIDSSSDNDKVIVVAATNRMNAVDPALLRSGRLTQKFEVAPTNLSQTLLIVKKKLENIPHTLTEPEIEELSNLIQHSQPNQKGLTQADVAEFFNSVNRFLVFNTSHGEKTDFKLFKELLKAE